jgi:hypothetical protein
MWPSSQTSRIAELRSAANADASTDGLHLAIPAAFAGLRQALRSFTPRLHIGDPLGFRSISLDL